MALNFGSSFVGDAGSGGKRGIVPAPAAGDAAAGKFLKADGSWTTPANGLAPGSGNGGNTAATIAGLAFYPLSATTLGARKGYAVNSTLTTILTYADDSVVDITTSGAGGVDLKALTGTIDTTGGSYVVTGTGTAFLSEFGTRALTGTGGTAGAPSTTVTGVGTRFTQECAVNDLIGNATGGYVQIASVDSDTQVTLSNNITLAGGSSLLVVEQPYLTIAGEPQYVNVILDDTNLYTSYNWIGTNTGASGYAGRGYGTGSPTNSWLNVFAIAKVLGSDPVLFGSTQRTTPLNLPTDYVIYRRVGAIQIRTNGSIQTVFTCKRDGDALVLQGAQENTFFVNAGSTLTTFQAANASNVIPPTATEAVLEAILSAGAGTNTLIVSDTGVDDTYGIQSNNGSSGEFSGVFPVEPATQVLFYRASANGLTAYIGVSAYKDSCSVLTPPPATPGGLSPFISGFTVFPVSTTVLGVRSGNACDSTRGTTITLDLDGSVDLATTGLGGIAQKTLTGTVAITNGLSDLTGTGTAFLTEFGTPRVLTGTGGTGGVPDTTIVGAGTKWTRQVGINDLIGSATTGYAQVLQVDDASILVNSNLTITNGTTLSVIEQPSVMVASEPHRLIAIADDTNATIGSTWVAGPLSGQTAYAGVPSGAQDWLNVFVIAKPDGSTPGVIGSLQRSAPLVLPATYTLYRRLGAIQIRTTIQFNTQLTSTREGAVLIVRSDPEGGYAISGGTSAVDTRVDLGDFVPPTSYFFIGIAQKAGGSWNFVAPFPGYASAATTIADQLAQYQTPLPCQAIYYSNVGGGSTFLAASGYHDNCDL